MKKGRRERQVSTTTLVGRPSKTLKKRKKKNETVCCQQGERYIMTPQADTISRMPMTYIYKIAAVNVAPTSLFLYSIGRLLQNFFFPFDKSSTSQTRFTDSFKINKIINWRLTVVQVKEKKNLGRCWNVIFLLFSFGPGIDKAPTRIDQRQMLHEKKKGQSVKTATERETSRAVCNLFCMLYWDGRLVHRSGKWPSWWPFTFFRSLSFFLLDAKNLRYEKRSCCWY